jgi:glycosyltransferase involved in cell wall biosynthesis
MTISNLPLVSIITPSYNQAHFLEFTIRSVLEQDYPNTEYILVDGGSTDGSVDIVKRHADRFSWWISEKDKGHADALNKGFSHARGEILAWLNSDDTYYPGAVTEAVTALQAHPDVGMVYGDADLTNESGKVIGHFASRQTDYRKLLRGSVHIPQATTFFRANLWKEVGPLSLSLFYAFDYDLWVRFAKTSKILYVPHKWATFRLHDDAKSIINDDLCYPDMLQVYAREQGRGLSFLYFRATIRRLTYSWLPLRFRIYLRELIYHRFFRNSE